ncbi:MAG: adenylyl-sulfate kinase, partial [Propionibacteriaceae bacterium]|nr:adenylyl-sulfate kinase [Propionibacteriaceae bacterium]
HGPLRSRKLDSGILSEADLVLTAEAAHRNFIVEEWPTAYRRVFTFSQFATTIAALPATLAGSGLVDEAYRRRVRASRSGDVPDPYRRGPAAAASASALIDRYLADILPRLA